jgi:ABC-type branched-subunit amino acid transport system ATPase component
MDRRMTAVLLSTLRAPKPRFARSVNIERDAGVHEALTTFLPVGRALDVIDRLATVLATVGTEKALSITGPYGSGKSSLALLLDGLLAPAGLTIHKAARGVVHDAAPLTLEKIDVARALGRPGEGLLRCFATAQQEPVSRTVLRAVLNGLAKAAPTTQRRHRALAARAEALLKAKELEPRSVASLVSDMSAVHPLVLLLDEFGKSLEAAAQVASDADLFLLQELAERSLDNSFAVVTLQHMGYGDYASELSAAQRRDWAKVQGRFEEISYVEGPSQTLRLVASAFEDIADAGLRRAVADWTATEATAAEQAGLSDLTLGVVASAWPLHPAALNVLPELVQRYGQNERTLFSFLASNQARSVSAWLAENYWSEGQTLPSVRLPQLYDYFVDAATSMSGYSAAATRWLEIDTRIRDARGLDPAQLRVVKAVGLLNLVAAGGELRASRALLRWAVADGHSGTASGEDVAARLKELEDLGLLSWRDFSDEYRIWHGSDFDVRGAVDRTRRQLSSLPVEHLLSSTVPLSPVVAARHSHRTGTLRHFDRRWVGRHHEQQDEAGSADGAVLFSIGTGRFVPTGQPVEDNARPVVVVVLTDTADVVDAAREVAALAALDDVAPKDDWVVLRELAERRAEARAALDLAVDAALQRVERRKTGFFRLVGHELQPLQGLRPLSAVLSDVADVTYAEAPEVRNELLNRQELSSQAAKARRELLEAVLKHRDQERLGIEGFGPERSMYESVLRATGLHRLDDGLWRLGRPTDTTFVPAWDRLLHEFESSQRKRRSVQSIFDTLASPPLGVRTGLAPVLLTCALLDQADVVAVYEHGTFKAGLTGDLLERLVRNPQHFEIKHFSTRSGARSASIQAYAEALSPLVDGRTIKPTVVSVVGVLVQTINALPEYSKRTSRVSRAAQKVRAVLLAATEPDVLLFDDLPRALGLPHVPADAGETKSGKAFQRLANEVAGATSELVSAYGALLAEVAETLSAVTGSPAERLQPNLRERVALLHGKVLDPRVRRFVSALGTELDERGWLEYVGMVVAQTAPTTWRDEDVDRFEAALEDLGGTFRRVEALNVEANALERNAAFEASRITVTSPDGREEARLVWVEQRHTERLQGVLDQALSSAMAVVGGQAQARDALLALLARSGVTVGGQVQDGARHRAGTSKTGTD